MPFTLEVIEPGTDRRGKPITSCIVHHEDTIMATNRTKLGRKPEVDPENLLKLLPQDSTASWKKAADTEHGISKSSFYRSVDKFKSRRTAIQCQDGTWKRHEPLKHQGFPAVPEYRILIHPGIWDRNHRHRRPAP